MLDSTNYFLILKNAISFKYNLSNLISTSVNTNNINKFIFNSNLRKAIDKKFINILDNTLQFKPYTIINGSLIITEYRLIFRPLIINNTMASINCIYSTHYSNILNDYFSILHSKVYKLESHYITNKSSIIKNMLISLKKEFYNLKTINNKLNSEVCYKYKEILLERLNYLNNNNFISLNITLKNFIKYSFIFLKDDSNVKQINKYINSINSNIFYISGYEFNKRYVNIINNFMSIDYYKIRKIKDDISFCNSNERFFSNTYYMYNNIKEYNRQKLSFHYFDFYNTLDFNNLFFANNSYLMCNYNSNYKHIKSYPNEIIIPNLLFTSKCNKINNNNMKNNNFDDKLNITKNNLKYNKFKHFIKNSVDNRLNGRIPVLTYHSYQTKSNIWRSSESLNKTSKLSFLNFDVALDYQYIESIIIANLKHESDKDIKKLYIYDTRSEYNLKEVGNKLINNYNELNTLIDMNYCNIGNLHSINTCYLNLKNLISLVDNKILENINIGFNKTVNNNFFDIVSCEGQDCNISSNYNYVNTNHIIAKQNKNLLSNIENSKWLCIVSNCIKASCDIVEKIIHLKNIDIIIYDSEGLDTTSCISSICQILLDSYYRTIEGFIILFEKEWISFGNNIQIREYLNNSNFKRNNNNNNNNIYNLNINNYNKILLNDKNNNFFNESYLNENLFKKNNSNQNISNKNNTNCKYYNEYHEFGFNSIFYLFLECLYNIIIRYPMYFEYNGMFILKIYQSVFDSSYYNFFIKDEKVREINII